MIIVFGLLDGAIRTDDKVPMRNLRLRLPSLITSVSDIDTA